MYFFKWEKCILPFPSSQPSRQSAIHNCLCVYIAASLLNIYITDYLSSVRLSSLSVLRSRCSVLFCCFVGFVVLALLLFWSLVLCVLVFCLLFFLFLCPLSLFSSSSAHLVLHIIISLERQDYSGSFVVDLCIFPIKKVHVRF